jgi:cell division septation protein DedD
VESLLNIIRELLEAQDYAQVPGLGRFYYQEVTARRSKKQNTITPPCRMLVFNDESSKNNQQFIEHFAAQEHCNLFNAATEVSSLVNHIKQTLKTRGTYYMDCVGTLIAGNNKTYFQPDITHVFSEYMYGLEVLTMEPLTTRNSSLPKVHRAAPAHGEQVTEESKHNWIIHLNKKKVGYTLGAVATLLILVCLSLPFTEKYHIGFASLHNLFCSTVVDTFNENSKRNADTTLSYEQAVQSVKVVPTEDSITTPIETPKAIISEEELIEKHNSLVDNGKLPETETKASTETAVKKTETTEVPVSKKAETTEVAATKKAETAETKKEVNAETKKPTVTETKKPAEAEVTSSHYTIVLASAVTEKNADEFIERLKKNGYKEAKKYKKGSMLRVIYSGFASEGEARTQLKKLRSYEAFEQAWIYEMK